MSITLSHRGLPEGVRRRDLEDLAVEIGREVFCFSETTIQLLLRILKKTSDADYLPGAICGMWEQPQTTADYFKISTRALSYKERELEEAGLIVRTGTAHARRNGKRAQGRILYLAGINAAPIINRYDELREMLAIERSQMDRAPYLRLLISERRAAIRLSGNSELIELADSLTCSGRTLRITNIERLEMMNAELEVILVQAGLPSGAKSTSDRSETGFVPNIPRKPTSERNTRVRPSDWMGEDVSSITPAAAIRLASLDFRTTLELLGDLTWPNMVDAARRVCTQLGITEWVWGQACSKLGIIQAALCVLAVDRNFKLPSDHPFHCKRPSGALFKMARKAPSRLNLYGLLRAIEGYSEGFGDNVVAMPQPAVQWHQKGFHEMGALVPDIVARLQIDRAESEQC
jgi:replication initiation protein RepC